MKKMVNITGQVLLLIPETALDITGSGLGIVEGALHAAGNAVGSVKNLAWKGSDKCYEKRCELIKALENSIAEVEKNDVEILKEENTSLKEIVKNQQQIINKAYGR